MAAMNRPLAGIKVVEVSMWAFVPAAGAVLADMGAEVVKIEPPAGDPMRWLTYQGIAPGAGGFTFLWDIFNRGKRSITMDLNVEGATEVLHRLLEDADVFLVSLLPSARRKLKIDIEEVTGRHPRLIYAVGSGQGAFGPEADKGGYDSLSFWARGGVASAVTPDGSPHVLQQPTGAFGDSISGAILAGGVAAALAQRAMTGKVSVVDASLLGTSMWVMQTGIVGATVAGVNELPKLSRDIVPNPLVNSYRTADGRFIALCMLQSQRYWPGFCEAAGRPELITDPRFDTDENRTANLKACVAMLDELFATRTLAEWERILSSQEGQWNIVQQAGELARDPQAVANRFIQEVDYGDGRALRMVSTPLQFDRQALDAHPAPELGAHNDQVLAEVGYLEEQILNLKMAGIIF